MVIIIELLCTRLHPITLNNVTALFNKLPSSFFYLWTTGDNNIYVAEFQKSKKLKPMFVYIKRRPAYLVKFCSIPWNKLWQGKYKFLHNVYSDNEIYIAFFPKLMKLLEMQLMWVCYRVIFQYMYIMYNNQITVDVLYLTLNILISLTQVH